jgi:hypothetical protein
MEPTAILNDQANGMDNSSSPPRTSMLRSMASCLMALSTLPAVAFSQGTPTRPAATLPSPATASHFTLAARRITGTAPTIDGRLDEAVWRSAPVATDFVQQRPDPGAPATERTEARVLYDDDAVYIGMWLYTDDPSGIATAIARRDYTGYSDWAQVMIDSHHDRRTAFRFAVNPSGVQKDALEYDDGHGEDVSWDAVWQAAAHTDSAGWTAEFRIPLSQLRFTTRSHGPDGSAAPAQTWGIDFLRDIARLNERDYWAPLPADGSRMVSVFGDLTGLASLSAPRRLEVLPYTLASVTNAPAIENDPFFHQNDLDTKLGADLKYGLTGDLTLTATVNPDFGQVEADPSVVNLTAFETFFPEKRPFFVEGSDLFEFDIGFPFNGPSFNFGNDQPFYSRRVGRAPQGGVPDSAVYVDAPEASTILGAVKLSGKTARGWTLGFMDALTKRERADYTGPAGERLTAPIEPLTNYAVARVKKDFRQGESSVGGIFTAADRSIHGSALSFLPAHSYTAGLDGLHRFGGGNYQLNASALGSYVRGDQSAISLLQTSAGHYYQRPDASYIDFDPERTSLGGFAASADVEKIAGGHWRWELAGHARSPGFDMNDVGFEQSTDWLLEGALLQYVDFQPGKHVRNWDLYAQHIAGWSFGGERRTTSLGVGGDITLLDNWGGYFNATHQFSALSTDALRGGPALVTPAYDALSFGINSDTRKPVNVQLSGSVEYESETARRAFYIEPDLSIRPSGRFEFTVGPYVQWNRNPWQYVAQLPALGSTRYLFGRIDQTTTALTLRARYSLTPTLSFEFYGEPFISAGDYSEFKDVADPRAERFDDRFHTFTPSELSYDGSTRAYGVDLDADGASDLHFADPDFNIKQFRSTAVVRWEYRPGSTLFVVWSQGRTQFSPTGVFELGHDARELFDAPATNVFLVKFNYWLSL